MEHKPFKTPILLIVFARPDLSALVFEQIRKLRPEKLFVTGDGGRNPAEWEKCKEARRVIEKIDWPCEVKTLFRDKNMGCKWAISSAISWFFENVEEGIILEDDCLPDPSFFPFCEELLEKYRDDKRVMHISGDNFQQNNKDFKCDGDYYFSTIAREWGWATWRRAWNLYDINMTQWPSAREGRLLCNVFEDKAVAYRWGHLFNDHTDKKKEAKMDAWDGQWVFACIVNDGLCINPRTNLVSNTGFRTDARRYFDPNDNLANLPTKPVNTPLNHPPKMEINYQADAYDYKYTFNINRYPSQKIKWFFKSKFTKPYLLLKKLYYRVLLKKSFNDGEKLLIC